MELQFFFSHLPNKVIIMMNNKYPFIHCLFNIKYPFFFGGIGNFNEKVKTITSFLINVDFFFSFMIYPIKLLL